MSPAWWPSFTGSAWGRTSCRAGSGRSPGARASRTTGSRSRGSARPTPTSGARCARQQPGRLRPGSRSNLPDEAEALIAIARRARLGTADRPPLDVLFRLNPAVVPETAAGLAVGAAGSKFGMTETELTSTVERVAADADGALVPRGIHLHVGSQLGAVDAWRDAVRRGLARAGPAAGRTRPLRHARPGWRLSGRPTRPARARVPNASHGSSRRSSRRSPSTGNHGGSSSNRDASSSPVPAGWWPASSTSVAAPAPTWSARSCSTRA